MNFRPDALPTFIGNVPERLLVDPFQIPPEETQPFQLITQHVEFVKNFSSQYGPDISLSYNVSNMVGKPRVFPSYGDFPESYFLRTYGTWEQKTSSRDIEYMPQNNQGAIISEDFVECAFEQSVFPCQIFIYETFNPGALVRIWCGVENIGWVLLWEQPPSKQPSISRAFCPDITNVKYPTRLIRLEFNQSLLDYHAAFDGVVLLGTKELQREIPENTKVYSLCSKIQSMNLWPVYNASDEEFLKQRRKMIEAVREIKNSMREAQKTPECDYFSILPNETILKIFTYLDLMSLTRCLLISKRFNELASDPLFYTSLSFKPYWYRINSSTLRSFVPKCLHLQRLDLSWCGSYGSISADEFIAFLRQCGSQITHLKLNNSGVFNESTLEELAVTCGRLKELCLRNCPIMCSSEMFNSLAQLTQLERLDLYRSSIDSSSLVKIIMANPNLKYINVDSCGRISSMDDVAFALAACCKHLLGANFWKSYSLSCMGVNGLSACTKLEELDIGWCSNIGLSEIFLPNIARKCTNLTRLVLAGNRYLVDVDLIPVFDTLTKLRYLDLLGVHGITAQVGEKILTSCPDLQLLDISFCTQISDEQVKIWRDLYPKVSIKRSFQLSAEYHFMSYIMHNEQNE